MLRKSFFQVPTLTALMLAFMARGIAQTAGPRAVITQAIDENRLVTLVGNTRPEANSKNDLGPVGNDLHLDMYLQLKRSPQRELAAQQFVESLTDKASPNFHKWITAAEYGQRFGAASEDIATVSRWLESHGFTVNAIPSNHLVIDFSGNAGQVRDALHTEIHTLEVAGERHFAADRSTHRIARIVDGAELKDGDQSLFRRSVHNNLLRLSGNFYIGGIGVWLGIGSPLRAIPSRWNAMASASGLPPPHVSCPLPHSHPNLENRQKNQFRSAR